MLADNTQRLFEIYYRPRAAMSRIIDEGSVLYGAGAVVLVSLLMQAALFLGFLGDVAVHELTPPAAQGTVVPAPVESETAEGPSQAPEDFEGHAGDPQGVGRRLPPMARLGLGAISVFGTLATFLGLVLLYAPATLFLVRTRRRSMASGVPPPARPSSQAGMGPITPARSRVAARCQPRGALPNQARVVADGVKRT